MIELSKLTLVNYCHPDCVPLKNIMRLPKLQAFQMAKQFADSHPETTAFYRFADFENYYNLRVEQDKYLYDTFLALGGNPKEEHPLSFVIEGSDYLSDWFGNGIETRILLSKIAEEHISFTLGDSGAEFGRNKSVELLTLKQFEKLLHEQSGDYNDFMKKIGKQYVEVQIWSDEYFE
ncbi:MAG: hypothetical protein Q4D51_09190 [Eubacteriales bacterium]|nr:hypothetical protein [Eubacteriales bacterium]